MTTPSSTAAGADGAGVEARRLEREQKRALLRQLLAGSADGVTGRHPTSYPQQRLWFMHQLSPTTRAYHVESVTPLRGSVSPAALSRALDRIAERHAVLRTTFTEVDGEPWQVVAPRGHVPLALVDLSRLPPARRTDRVERLLHRWSHEPFDLERGPLVRGAVVRLASDEHLLALYLHHIVADGWSMGIFGRELDLLYREEVEGVPASLPALSAQYVDFAGWQRRHLSGETLEQQLGYWRAALRDLATLDLPTDRPRPPVQRFEGGHLDFELPAELHHRLLRLGSAEGTTLFMTLLAGYAVLLARWTGSRDLPVGTYMANRRRPEWEHLVGFFLNTLVLRLRVDPQASFRRLLAEVREVALGAYDHQDLPFELVVEALSPPRDLSRNPLFQVVFQLNNQPTQDPHANTVEAARARRDAAVFDLGLMMFETPAGLAGQFEYSSALFDERTVRDLARRFELLLTAALDTPDAPVAQLPVLSPEERAVWAAPDRTARTFPLDTGLLDLFARRCAQHPDAVAFVEGRRSLSYRALDRAANRVAGALLARGVDRGEGVAVLVERGIAAPAAVLGVLKAGASWVPLEPSWPERRRAECLAVAGVRLVLAAPGTAVPPGTRLVDLRQALTEGPDSDPGIRPTARDRAYVLCTSGSTGTPKAAAAPHVQVLNRLHWMWREHPWRPGEVAAMKTSLAFVDSVWELFGGLLQGVPTVVVPPGSVADARELVGVLGAARVSRLWLVPSLLRTLLDEVPDLRSRLPVLDFWVSSGEELPLELYERFRAAMPGARLFNLYGTTEVWDATWCDPERVDLTRGRVPIGRPIDNVRVYVLDPEDRPLPPGWPGELHVAGLGLGEGYLGEAARNGAFRVVDLDGRAERVYATGDRALVRADGELEYLGRRDRQAKVRGTRVELAEVEEALAAHPGVASCAVLASGNPETVLVAYWAASEGQEPPEERELREHLRRRLPPSSVPERLVRIATMPLTTSGKVDRTRLLQAVPAQVPAGACDQGQAPVGELEEAVAEVWAALLGRDGIGRDDDFFADLGGHSLLGVRALSRLRSEHGVDLPLRVLFEEPTVRGLAAAAERARGSGARAAGLDGGRIPRVDRAAHRLEGDP